MQLEDFNLNDHYNSNAKIILEMNCFFLVPFQFVVLKAPVHIPPLKNWYPALGKKCFNTFAVRQEAASYMSSFSTLFWNYSFKWGISLVWKTLVFGSVALSLQQYKAIRVLWSWWLTVPSLMVDVEFFSSSFLHIAFCHWGFEMCTHRWSTVDILYFLAHSSLFSFIAAVSLCF